MKRWPARRATLNHAQPRTRGRPRKSDESETPHRINPEREARVHISAHGSEVHISAGMAVEDCTCTCSTHTPIAMRHRKHTSCRYWSAWAARIMIVAYEDSRMLMLGRKCYTRAMTRSTLESRHGLTFYFQISG